MTTAVLAEVDDAGDEVDMSYEPFSREPQYIEANRAFVRGLGLHRDMQILDVACGTATMTDLMLESLFAPGGWGDVVPADAVGGAQLRVFGVDLSAESLRFGREHLARLGFLQTPEFPSPLGAVNVVELREGPAESLPLPDASVDFAIMGNAIQLVDRAALFRELSRVLRPGARFAFNTSFYAGTYTPGTEHVYIRWVQEALSYLRQRDAEMRAKGGPGIARKRGKGAPAFSRPWWTAGEYSNQAAEFGFVTESVHERTVMLNQRCFETIGAYNGLARVLLSGYPVKLASEALERAAGPTLAAVGMNEVPRYWLEMVLRKPGQATTA